MRFSSGDPRRQRIPRGPLDDLIGQRFHFNIDTGELRFVELTDDERLDYPEAIEARAVEVPESKPGVNVVSYTDDTPTYDDIYGRRNPNNPTLGPIDTGPVDK